MYEKHCSKCGILRTNNEFSGRNGQCNICKKEYESQKREKIRKENYNIYNDIQEMKQIIKDLSNDIKIIKKNINRNNIYLS